MATTAKDPTFKNVSPTDNARNDDNYKKKQKANRHPEGVT